MSRFTSIFSLTLALGVSSAAGCGLQVNVIGEGESSEGSGENGESEGSTSSSSDSGETGGQSKAALDVLFVVDNSASMGAAQEAMVRAGVSMVEALEARGIDYRIAFTTTDNGNPWCPGTSPEGGGFVFESCRDRLTGFISQDGNTNVQAMACTSRCPYTGEELGIIPGVTRPWLERIDGVKNLAADPADAIACLLPQGIDGCGFEQPLESMHKTLVRSETDSEPGFGFVRSDANLLVVIITDEADCSHNPEHETIFAQDGNKAFWWDSSATFPTSAVCWNAGTQCEAEGEGLRCSTGNYDVDGQLLVNDATDAVLRFHGRYTDQLERILDEKREARPDARVEVALVAGYALDGTLNYAETSDLGFMSDFGIGPGCERDEVKLRPCDTQEDCMGWGGTCTSAGFCETEISAVPPVRLEAVRSFNYASPYAISICSLSYSERFALIAEEMSSGD